MRRVRTGLVRLLIFTHGLLLPLAASAAAGDADGYRLDASQIFTLFFIMLGPLKMLGPFAQATRGLEAAELNRLAWKAALIGVIALVAGGLLGNMLMIKWSIPQGALQLTAGLVFFLVALKAVMAPYGAVAAYEPHHGRPNAMQIAFPMVVTPYGIAAAIVMLASARDAERLAVTLAMLIFVMALNLLCMIFVRTIMRPMCAAVLQVLGAVLGLLQVALSIAIMRVGLHLLLGSVAPPA